ncbi:hypothetical protein BDP27DRAFT_433120 [Rhodocollybia butyracea]|uniref:Uncharacterized protein n=1 Tax=Rhodocollybia butyracea TaxID=206335 RepID=A0A9P5PBA2_9AGAR|nr:hypothetical protein BDP27DRAFT_433120 [Rhodocollybia butyracea]
MQRKRKFMGSIEKSTIWRLSGYSILDYRNRSATSSAHRPNLFMLRQQNTASTLSYSNYYCCSPGFHSISCLQRIFSRRS